MRIRDWYFQGWERREDENGQTALVYTGEYYAFPGGAARAKPPCLLMTTGLLALYLPVAFFPSEGGMWHFAAIPPLLEVIPLIYLVMGAVNLLRGKEPMTFRDWYASWRRMETAALWSAILTALMTALELVYILVIADGLSLPAEPLYLLGEAGCAALSITLFLFLKKHPCVQSVDPAKKE